MPVDLADPVVFDAEPLVAYSLDEPGSDRVEAYLDGVYDGDAAGYVNVVTLTEVHYVLARVTDVAAVDGFVDHLDAIGVTVVEAGPCWRATARYKRKANPSLGDAFALATAEHVDGTLLAGGDDDFDAVSDVPVERFRTGAA